jgi:hypothetical protein
VCFNLLFGSKARQHERGRLGTSTLKEFADDELLLELDEPIIVEPSYSL